MLFAFVSSLDEVIVAILVSTGRNVTVTKVMFDSLRDEIDPTITAVSTLMILASFLGLGVAAPTPEWGVMIADGTRFIRQAWGICTFPGLAAISLGLGLIFLGDGLGRIGGRKVPA